MPKIGLDQIIVSENIRKDYKDIEELADSIKKRGQLEPVIVKKAEPKDGTPMYELVAGFRRRHAIQMLFDKGEGHSQIDAVIVTGDRLTIQLIENLQRSDLSAREREEGIALMVQSGLSQKEVAAELSKKTDYISRHITAHKIRQIAETAKIDTAEMETFTLTEIASAKEKDIPMLLGYIKSGGGTKEAARKIMADYRGNKKSKPEAEPAAQPQSPEDKAKADYYERIDNATAALGDPRCNNSEINNSGDDLDPLAGVDTPPEPVKRPSPHREPIRREDTDPDHRIIDLQIVFDKIYGYLDRLKKKIADEGAESEGGIIAQYKVDAAYDIVAELHQVEGV